MQFLKRLEDLKTFIYDEKDKNIVIFGAGYWGEYFCRLIELLGFQCNCFVDNDTEKTGIVLLGKKVLDYNSFVKEMGKQSFIIVATINGHAEIEHQLISCGFKANKDFVYGLEFLFDNDYDYAPCEGKIEYISDPYSDKDLNDYVCLVPFKEMWVGENDWRMCCDQYIKDIKFDSLTLKNVDSRWNSFDAQKLRESVLDGSYRYCVKDTCIRYLRKRLVRKNDIKEDGLRETIELGKTDLDFGPELLNVAFDPTCNLFCKQCRNEKVITKNSKQQGLLEYYKNNCFPGTKCILLAGNGEVFVSGIYREFLEIVDDKHFPDLKTINIYTNANIIDDYAKSKLLELAEKYGVYITVSLDACRNSTYKRIRRGGDFEKVKKNLSLFRELREDNKIQMLKYNFCVHRENFREMKDFVDFSEEYGADMIWFQRLRGAREWECVHKKGNVYYNEFKDILRDEIFKNDNIDVTQFRYFIDEEEIRNDSLLWSCNNREFMLMQGMMMDENV